MKVFSKIRKAIIDVTSTALTLLCLGIIIQLLINDTILGWDPVGNIKKSGGAWIGVFALVLLYVLFIQKKKD